MFSCPNLSCVFDSDDESELLYNMMFWQEVSDYELYKDRTADRRASISRAWDIFNKYIASDAACSIGKSILYLMPATAPSMSSNRRLYSS